MSGSFIINWNWKTFEVEEFDSTKTMDISIDIETYNCITLSPKQVNELITFLVTQMKSINEPVDILSK